MSAPARIAFVAPRWPGDGAAGGAETLLRALAQRAADAGRDVEFLTTCARDHFTWKNERPAGVERFGALTVRFFPVDADRNPSAFLHAQQRISGGGPVSPETEAAWLRHSVHSQPLLDHLRAQEHAIDRVVAGPYLFGVTYRAALLHPRKTLLVPCLHDEPFARLALMRPLFEGVAGVLFNSEPERDFARRLFSLPAARSHVVGMGIEPFEADGADIIARRGLRAPYLMYAGRRETGKGTPMLCDYLAAFRARTGRDVRLVLAGSGPVEAPSELLPHILDLGYAPEEEKRAAMAGALAFAHPSALESLGIVLLEAFLAGTPALVNAWSEVLTWQCQRSGAGLWFRNYPEFEAELLLMLDQERLRRRMGEAGRAFVLREYAWDRVLPRFFQALEKPDSAVQPDAEKNRA